MLSACAPAVQTGDTLIDRVVSRQSGVINRTPCVGVRGPTRIFKKSDASGPPALFGAENINDPAAQRAARAISVSWKDAGNPDSYRIYGLAVQGECPMNVNRPAHSGNFAFVTYSDPGGEIGAYIFRKVGRDWQYVERVRLGFW